MNKWFKRAAVFCLTAGLAFSSTITALAADMAPRDYIFKMVLRSCGVVPGSRVSAWEGAFEGYLKKTGNQALLNQLKSYNNLSWGATAEGIDSLYLGVREWLSSASVQELGDGSFLYNLSSVPAPHLNKTTDLRTYSVNSVPFSGPYDLPADMANTYTYLFSDLYYLPGNRPVYYHRNLYIPKNIEVFGIVTGFYDHTDRLRIEFFTPDPSSATGYKPFTMKLMACAYYCDDDSLYGRWSNAIDASYDGKPSCSVMNYPFKVFGSAEAAQNYCTTGIVSGLFTDDFVSLTSFAESFGADPELIKQDVSSVGAQLSLPDNLASASAVITALSVPLELDALTSALKAGGMEIAYSGTYTVEHYKQDVSDLSAPVTWIKESEESLSGIIGQDASFTSKSYPHFLYTPELAEPAQPKVLPKGALVIRLYYKPDPDAVLPYTVEYYKDGEVFKTVPGTVPMFGDRMVTECADFCPRYYLPDTKSSTPLPFQVTDTKDTIRISYKRDPSAVFPYTVEYYKDGELFKSVPGSVSVFAPSIKTCISFCPAGYVLDTASSTSLPCTIPEESGVIKCYYVKRASSLPYTVEYYKDGLRMSTFSGHVPASAPELASCPSYCPEYYKLDTKRSTPMPCTISDTNNRIRVYYEKDEKAVFPYTVECYQNGEPLETVSKTVSVFSPSVTEYGHNVPKGYVVDTSSSTPLPYSVSKKDHVIKLNYIKEEASFPYTVEYYKDGKQITTRSGYVPASAPVVTSCWSYAPDGYVLDKSSSDSLPFTVTKDRHVIHMRYIPDPSSPYTSFTEGTSQMTGFVSGLFSNVFFWLFILVVLFMFIRHNLFLFKRISSHAAGKPRKPKEKQVPKARFKKWRRSKKGFNRTGRTYKGNRKHSGRYKNQTPRRRYRKNM